MRPATETIVHDLDGNLTSDSLWDYTWNGENRLIEIETSAAAVTVGAAKRRWEFGYDGGGRRVRKVAYQWNSGSSQWDVEEELLFVYDGWNMIAEIAAASGEVQARNVWGLDLSGTLQGAGGVGGLLSREDVSRLPVPMHYAYDGNGNVSALVRGSDGARVASYDYSAFGKLLRSEGPEADRNPFRFSTKFQEEVGLLYYGFRYYNLQTGRWASRDPIGEDGGSNLYAFVRNGPADEIDLLGLLVRSPLPRPINPAPPTLPHSLPRIPVAPYPQGHGSSAPQNTPTTTGLSSEEAALEGFNELKHVTQALERLKYKDVKNIKERRVRRRICPCVLKTKINYGGLPFITRKARAVIGTYSTQDPNPPRGTAPSSSPAGWREAQALYGKRWVHRGHLWAKRFGGKGQLRNITPMHYVVNLSQFKIFENNVARMASHNTNVCFLVVPHYRAYFGVQTSFNTIATGFFQFPVPRYITVMAIGANSGEVYHKRIDMQPMQGHPFDMPPFDPITGRGVVNKSVLVQLN